MHQWPVNGVRSRRQGRGGGLIDAVPGASFNSVKLKARMWSLWICGVQKDVGGERELGRMKANEYAPRVPSAA